MDLSLNVSLNETANLRKSSYVDNSILDEMFENSNLAAP